MRLGHVLAISMAFGCHPPEAPTELEDLCAYMFTHVGDDDPDYLEAGVTNLGAWLALNRTSTEDGYEINNLDQETLDALDDRERPATGLHGASVSTVSDYEVAVLADALVLGDQMQVYPDNYDTFERDFSEDTSCFMNGECDLLNYETDIHSSLPLGITLHTQGKGQFRWILPEDGPTTLASRSWLMEPAEVSVDFLAITAQYYLTVTVPVGGDTVRLHAMWAEASIANGELPESTALNLMINQLQDADASLYAYTETN